MEATTIHSVNGLIPLLVPLLLQYGRHLSVGASLGIPSKLILPGLNWGRESQWTIHTAQKKQRRSRSTFNLVFD